jgi:hypothetical protein
MTIHYVTVQTAPPRRGSDCGVIEEGWYRIEGDCVHLVTQKGTQRSDKKGNPIKAPIPAGHTARSVAWRLTKQHMPNRGGGFNRKLIYPTIRY